MRHLRIFGLTLALLALVLSGINVTAYAAENESIFQPSTPMYDVVFELEQGESPYSHAVGVLAQLDVPREENSERIRFTYEHAINGYALSLTEAEAAKANRLFGGDNSYGISSIVPASTFQIPSSDMTFTALSGQQVEQLRNVQLTPAGVERVGATPIDASTVDVAVIDTGSDMRHPDLNVVGGVDCIGDDAEAYGEDGHGHGTHVAGTIAAKDNGAGVVGVAPDARIHSVRVLDASGAGSTATVLCGIDWVVEHADEIEVANMSLGGAGFESACFEDDPMHNAICVATEQTVFVVAAGNSSAPTTQFSPANYHEVITVSAYTDYDGIDGGFSLTPTDRCTVLSVDDTLAAFSNYGEHVDVTAPGVCVLSTYDGGYAYASGTSMASPHGAGCVARFLADNPDQREFAEQQVLTWSEEHTEGELIGDPDGEREPLLWCGEIPRYEGS